MTIEFAALGAVAAVAGFGLAFATFWLTFGSRIATAESAAAAALAQAKDASEKTTLMSTSFALYREQVARDYIHREVMREVEDRLTAAIDRLGDRLDRFVEAAVSKHA